MYQVCGIVWYNVEANALFQVNVLDDKGTLISFDSDGCRNLIITESTGLYGVKDGKETELYEGDIVVAWSEGVKATCVVKWRQGGSPMFILYPAWQFGKSFEWEHWHIHASTLDTKGGVYYDDLNIVGNQFENTNLLPEIT